MTENEGIYITKARKPNNKKQEALYAVVSGTATGRDKWLIRHDKKSDALDTTRHQDNGKRQPPYKRDGKHDLVYDGIEHNEPNKGNLAIKTQGYEKAKRIVATIVKNRGRPKTDRE